MMQMNSHLTISLMVREYLSHGLKTGSNTISGDNYNYGSSVPHITECLLIRASDGEAS